MLLVNLVAAVDLLNKQTELLRIPRKEKRKGKKKRQKHDAFGFSWSVAVLVVQVCDALRSRIIKLN